MSYDIGPKIGVDGASDFKKTLAEINSTLRTQKTEMDAVTSAYDKNDTSTKRLLIENQAIVKQLKELEKEQNKAREAVEWATREYGENAIATQKAQQAYNKTTTGINTLNEQLSKNQTTLQYAMASADGTAESFLNMGQAAEEAADDTEAVAEGVDALGAALAAAGVAKTVSEIAAALRDCAAASIEFESAITGVYKTVDGTDAQLSAISDGIKEMSTVIPASTKELAGIAEAAGQLGIATDDVLGFSEVMANLSVTTNLTAEDAAKQLARFANITKTSADDYGRLGSTIVALGNNFATTESNIVAMATRLASAGTLAGLTESEILALAASMSSVGIEAEAGGTAMTQTFTAIEKAVAHGGDELESFAEIAGMSAGDFKNAWENEAVTAIQAFISGLGSLDEKGESATLTLEELGLSGVRQGNMLKSLGLASDVLAQSVDLSSKAWVENTALTNEAELRYGTLESKLQLLENSTNLLKIAIGDQLTPALSDLVDNGMAASEWATEFIQENEWVIPAAAAATTAIGALAVGITGYTAAVKLASVANAAFAATMANPVVMPVVVAIAALSAAVVGLTIGLSDGEDAARRHTKAIKEDQKAAEEWRASIAGQRQDARSLIAVIEEVNSTMEAGAGKNDQMLDLVSKLNEQIPGLALSYDALSGGLSMTTEEIERQTAAYLAQEGQAQRTEELNKAKTRLQEIEASLTEVQERRAAGEADEIHTRSEMISGVGKLTEQELALVAIKEELTAQISALNAESDSYYATLTRVGEGATTAAEFSSYLEEQLQGLASEYQSVKEAARDSLDSQIGQWEEVDNTAKTSASEIQKTLESQIAYWEKYNDNLQSLMDREVEGIDILTRELSDGSKESAAMLAGLATATDEEIRKIIASMQKTGEGKDAAAETIAALEADLSERFSAIEADAQEFAKNMDFADEMEKAAVNDMQGYINGILSKEGEMISLLKRVSNHSVNIFPETTDQHSPSKVYEDFGINDMQGYINGISEMERPLTAEMKSMAEAAAKAFEVDYNSATNFDDAKKALDHARAMNVISDRQYYDALTKNRDRYLQGAKDRDKYYSTTESIFAFEKKAIEEWEKAAEKALSEYEKQLEEAAATAAKAMKDIQKEMDAVTKLQESMAAKLGDYGELYDERTVRFNDGSSMELYDLTNLDKQIQELQRYGAMLDELQSRGLSDGLLSEVATMNVDEAVKYGELLLQKSDDDFKAYSDSWDKKQQTAAEIAERFYKSELDTLETEYNTLLEGSLAQLGEIANSSGEGVVQQLIDGMDGQEEALRAKMQEIADIVAQSFETDFRLSSVDTTGLEAAIMNSVPSAPVYASQPSQSDVTAGVISAISPMLQAAMAQPVPAQLVFQLPTGIELARVFLPDIRQASAESPLIIDDF